MVNTSKAAVSYKPKTKEEVALMHALYETHCSLKKVGREFNLSRERVRQLFKKFGFPIRRYTKSSELKRCRAEQWQGKLKILPQDELKRLYSTENLTLRETADRFSVSAATVKSNLLRYGIPLRTRVESFRIRQGNPALSEEALRRLYVAEKKTAAAIAEAFGYAPSSVKKMLWKRGIRKGDLKKTA